MCVSNQLHSISAGNNAKTEDLPGGYFPRMEVDQYHDYLVAHDKWRTACREIDEIEHRKALVRRGLSKFKEIVSFDIVPHPDAVGTRTIDVPGFEDSPGAPVELLVSLVKKNQQQPQVSTKTHKVEKRAAKKRLAEAIQREKIVTINDKVTALPEQAAEKRTVAEAVRKIKVLRPLQKEEKVAATSAAAIVKQIKFGSADLVANVDPQQGWKVVTRHKGDKSQVRLVHVTRSEGSCSVQADPCVGSIGKLAAAAVGTTPARLRPN